VSPILTWWLGAQTHAGENIGDTPTHVVLVELKGEAGAPTASPNPGRSD
jgi:beta-alanine degradation protein BauB